eukprot:827899-Amphidinium_carterae.1
MSSLQRPGATQCSHWSCHCCLPRALNMPVMPKGTQVLLFQCEGAITQSVGVTQLGVPLITMSDVRLVPMHAITSHQNQREFIC